VTPTQGGGSEESAARGDLSRGWDGAGIAPVHSSYDGKDHEVSQLYLTAISVENGAYTSYRSVYLWNQPTPTLNTTPVWDMLQIPPATTIY
jgi:hypothetical protein